MTTLRFDFTQAATRGAIVEQLDAALAAAGLQADLSACEQVPERHHHDIGEIEETIDALAGVPERAQDDLRGVYRILAAAEARVHGCPVEHAHFHEVGNAAGIRNTLGICLRMATLAPDTVVATPLQTGSGKVRCAHGLMDVPAPATAAIVEEYGLPTCDNLLEGELLTPTSAAIIAHFVQRFEA